MKILIIGGANLNVLERRDASYGGLSYDEVKSKLLDFAAKRGAELEFFLSNHEGEIVEAVQNASCEALIVNAGAYSHYSLAIADALRILSIPKIEVHFTNIHAKCRHETVTGAACDGVICGLGLDGYKLAIMQLIQE